MARKPRIKSPLNVYHIVIKGANGQLLFEEVSDYTKYLKILKLQKGETNFELLAYCLMSNHVHLLIRTNEVPTEIIFKKINTTYANWFNMKYSRTGPLQDGRYYSEPIDSNQYLLSALRYIHRNPHNAGLENEVGEKYIWSSYSSYLTNNNYYVDTNIVLSEFNSINDFIEFHKTNTNESFLDIDKIRRRLPDDVASNIIKEICKIPHTTSLINVSLIERRNYIIAIHEKGVSIRQMNRLTGVPRGIIERILHDRL